MTELCQCDLFTVIENHGRFNNNRLLVGLLTQLVQAVKATHEAGLCHLDIKPENILVGQDNTLRLCDYGFAKSAGQ